ncbi:MAG: UvrD-helicase domain-containing protein [Gemmatimonadetes bacterium]|nr:UvrD-helicase domain-containing protein [Gemmatimonadota bacterium]
MTSDLRSPAAPPDQAARERILRDLETNFLVEAGAGSGKTTALSGRMVALVASGAARPDQIAAVTFTRKAAAELRERFREDLEKAMRRSEDAERRARLSQALTEVDRTFLGTIHAFAARLLRERPLEAGLDPGFQELQENEEIRLRRQFWNDHLERLAADGDPDLVALSGLGIQPERLRDAFHDMAENLDLEFPAPEVAAPTEADVALVRVELDGLLDRALEHLPDREPKAGWDEVQKKVQRAEHARRHRDWSRTESFLNHLYGFSTGTTKLTLNRWEPDRRAQDTVRTLRDDIVAFTQEGGPARTLLNRWWAHRYPTAVRFVRRAAEAYAAERRRLGLVSFQDLLLLTAELLRTRPATRRDLARRYPRLLIDEFQDTDPVQAEIAFLLASDPETDAPASPLAWWSAVPRPGALFVVGDPKQSIYRFRRADIAVYEQVRQRFAEFGEVLELNANFRSLIEIAAIANEVFEARFATEEPPVQARFRPLRPQRPFPDEPVPGRGVFRVGVDLKGAEGETREDRVQDEAERIAGWIRDRVDRGERTPGDFLVLTRIKRNLRHFARALEARGLPIEVAGAGVGSATELDELRVLLRALADPSNEVLLLAALTGLFVGLDHDALVEHRLAGGAFDLETPGVEGPVADALGELRALWERSRTQPADVFILGLVDETGLVPHAAAGELGSIRTGVMAYALDAVRAAAVAGDTSLIGALEALETALAWDEAEAPLRPGATDAVRLMNLHKAKGLEAPVVILADPGSGGFGRRTLHVERDEDGVGRAWFTVSERGGWNAIPLARPERWPEMQALEERFDKAEQERLLYVAATRARDELVIAIGENGRRRDQEAWTVFDEWLKKQDGVDLELPWEAASGRVPLERGAGGLVEAAAATGERRREAARPTLRFVSVTEQAKAAGDRAPVLTRAEERARGPRGYEWGSVVHATLAAAAHGRPAEELRIVGRDLLREYERPVDDAGEPTELMELLALVERIRGSDLWRRAEAASVRHVEVPIAVPLEDGGEGPAVLEGVLDLAFREADGWVVVDYKTDPGDDPDFPVRSGRYRAQVELYARAWEEASGEPVVERAVFYTTRGVVDRF